MTTPGRTNLAARLPKQNVKAGDYWAGVRFQICDDTSTPVDLVAEGWTDWRSQFRPSRGSAQIVELTVDASDAANGWIAVSASGLATQQMGGDGGFDVQALAGDGQPRTWVEGDIAWEQDYTR